MGRKESDAALPARSAEIVDAAITSRRSVRRFLPTPISRACIEEILEVSSRAPSGTNIQPWRVYVLGGKTRAALSQALVDAHLHGSRDHEYEYRYYPPQIPEPYISRRRKIGWDLYGLLGIERGQKDAMRAQHARNFEFFDAPVGLIFTIERVLEQGSWLDYGMFLQNIMIAARGRGLDTCPQAAFAQYHRIIRRYLKIPDEEMVICGMSIGFADNSVAENTLETERAPVAEFARFIDLD